MAQLPQVENIKQLIAKTEVNFTELAKIHGVVNFKEEASFAMEILSNNSYLMNTAVADQDSFKRAIINVASIGLSLNPIKKLAYLIPRGKKVVLDVSYRGLTQLAVEAGAIKWASADVVCANDTYEFQGMNREPVHKYNPFQPFDQAR